MHPALLAGTHNGRALLEHVSRGYLEDGGRMQWTCHIGPSWPEGSIDIGGTVGVLQ